MEPGGKRRRSRRESKSFYHIEFGNQDSSLQNLRRPSTTVTFITSLKVTKQTPRVSAASNEKNVESQVGDVGHLSHPYCDTFCLVRENNRTATRNLRRQSECHYQTLPCPRTGAIAEIHRRRSVNSSPERSAQ